MNLAYSVMAWLFITAWCSGWNKTLVSVAYAIFSIILSVIYLNWFGKVSIIGVVGVAMHGKDVRPMRFECKNSTELNTSGNWVVS